MAQTIGSSASAVKTAGANINATIAADAAQILIWANFVEQELCCHCRYDVVTNYGSLTTQGKQILDLIVDCKVAQFLISYEPEAIGTIGASLRLNYLQSVISSTMAKVTGENGKIKKYLAIPS